MRIYVDGYIYSHSPNGGVCRQVSEMLSNLSEDAAPHVAGEVDPRQGTFPIRHPRLSVERLKRFAFRPGRLANVLFPWRVRRSRQRAKADIYHPSYFLGLDQRPPGGRPMVITCHDMAHERFAQTLDPDGFWRRTKARVLAGADAVVCVSARTEEDLLEHLPELRGRTTVIASGTDSLPVVKPCPREEWGLLFVGGRRGYKRFTFSLEIVHALRQMSGKDYRLRVIGPVASDEEVRRLTDLGLTDAVEFLGKVSDEVLAGWYQRSRLLLYPSLWEGFGFPPLEAVRCGCLTAATPGTTVEDFLAPGGLFPDSDEADVWAGKIHETLVAPGLDRTLLAEGQSRVASLTWQRTGQLTEALYRSLVP